MGQSRQSRTSKAAPASHASSSTTTSTAATTASSLPQDQQAFVAGPSHALDSDLAAASMLPFPRFPGSHMPPQPPSYSLNAFDQQQSHSSDTNNQLDPLAGTNWGLPPAPDASGVHALDSPDNTSRDILDLFRKFIDLPSEDESDDPDFRPQEDREEDEWVAESDTASGDEEIVFNQSQDEDQAEQQQHSSNTGHSHGQGMPHAPFNIDSLLAIGSPFQQHQAPRDASLTALPGRQAATGAVHHTQPPSTSAAQGPQASASPSTRQFEDQADGHDADHEDDHNQAADASVEMPPPPPPPPKRRGRPRKVLTAEQEREANAAKAAKVTRNKIAPEDRKEAKLERNRASNKRRRTQAQMNADKMHELEEENAVLRARVVNLEDYIYSMAMGPVGDGTGNATARSAQAVDTAAPNATASDVTSFAPIPPSSTSARRAPS